MVCKQKWGVNTQRFGGGWVRVRRRKVWSFYVKALKGLVHTDFCCADWWVLCECMLPIVKTVIKWPHLRIWVRAFPANRGSSKGFEITSSWDFHPASSWHISLSFSWAFVNHTVWSIFAYLWWSLWGCMKRIVVQCKSINILISVYMLGKKWNGFSWK